MQQEIQELIGTSHWSHGEFFIERVTSSGKLNWAPHTLEIDLRVRAGDGVDFHLWRLRCAGVVTHSLSFDWGEGIEYLDQHALLWPHQRPATLWFLGRADDVAATIGHLYQTHADICGEWFSFDKFINTNTSLSGLLSGPGGRIAEGPQNVLEAYAQVLEAHGIRCSLTIHPQAAEVHLVLMGGFFVVCQHATLERINSEDGA
jgi:hypothetical protein